MILNRRRAIQTVFAIVALGVLVFVAAAFVSRNRPVFAALRNDVRDHQGSQLLNPFRQRAPERAAVSFLTRLLSGDCADALGLVGEDPARKQSVCESEQKYPMKGWRLEAIGQDRGRTLLRYGVSRYAGDRKVKDPFWIWVSKKSDQEYQVTGYEPWY